MPTHPENRPEDEDAPEPEGWTPEGEKKRDPDALLGKMMGMVDKLFGQAKQHSVMQQGPYIIVRAIANGYVIRYLEVKKSFGPIPLPGSQEVEVFAKDVEDAIPYIRQAFGHLEQLMRSLREPGT